MSESPDGRSPRRRKFYTALRFATHGSLALGGVPQEMINGRTPDSTCEVRKHERLFATHNINTTYKRQFSPPRVLLSPLLLETASEEQVPVSTYSRLMHNSSKLKFVSPRRPTSIRPTQSSRVPCSTPCGMRVGSRGGLRVAGCANTSKDTGA